MVLIGLLPAALGVVVSTRRTLPLAAPSCAAASCAPPGHSAPFFELGALLAATPPPPAQPAMPEAARPHQRAALNAVWRHFDGAGGSDGDGGRAASALDHRAWSSRATVVLPPGTGKTLVGLWALEASLQAGTTSVLVAPTLPLIDQTLAAYRDFSPSIASGRIKVLVVASDCADPQSAEYTCKADEIAAWLAQHGGSPVLVLSTYDSLPALAEGAQSASASLELCVFDEAHVMAGRGQKFAFGLDDAKLAVRRRVFLTGTPRVFVDRGAARAGRPDDSVEAGVARSMTDETNFGPTVYRMSYGQAVEAGLIVPLKLLGFSVSASYARLCASTPELAVAVADRRVAQETAELAVAIADAMNERNLSKVPHSKAPLSTMRPPCGTVRGVRASLVCAGLLVPLDDQRDEAVCARCRRGSSFASRRADRGHGGVGQPRQRAHPGGTGART